MQRTTQPKSQQNLETPSRWKKVGGGSLRIGSKIVKPGEIFKAFPHEIPQAFRDVIIPLDGQDVTETTPETIQVKSIYSLSPREVVEGVEYFDIVDGNGKVVNEKGLLESVALKLIESLHQ